MKFLEKKVLTFDNKVLINYIFDIKTIKVTFSLRKFNMLRKFTQTNSFSGFFGRKLSNCIVI